MATKYPNPNVTADGATKSARAAIIYATRDVFGEWREEQLRYVNPYPMFSIPEHADRIISRAHDYRAWNADEIADDRTNRQTISDEVTRCCDRVNVDPGKQY